MASAGAIFEAGSATSIDITLVAPPTSAGAAPKAAPPPPPLHYGAVRRSLTSPRTSPGAAAVPRPADPLGPRCRPLDPMPLSASMVPQAATVTTHGAGTSSSTRINDCDGVGPSPVRNGEGIVSIGCNWQARRTPDANPSPAGREEK